MQRREVTHYIDYDSADAQGMAYEVPRDAALAAARRVSLAESGVILDKEKAELARIYGRGWDNFPEPFEWEGVSNSSRLRTWGLAALAVVTLLVVTL